MTTSSKLIIAALVVTVVIIGIGYANITEQVLTISGELKAVAAQANFKIAFAGDGVVAEGSKGTVTATKETDTTATFSVEGLTEVGDTASATYTIKNSSEDLIADNLTATITKGNNNYFKVTKTELSQTTLNPDGEATITITAELIKTPITAQTQEVEITISANPVEMPVQ